MDGLSESTQTGILDEELSRRLHLALTTGKDGLHDLMEDPSPDVIHAALRNPQIDEDHLLTLLKRRGLTDELIRKVSKTPVFSQSHAAKVALAHNPDSPTSIVHPILQELHLFELVSILHLAGASPDLRLAAERAILQQLPGTSLGNKLTLARRATDAVLEALLKEGHPQVVEICLGNPRMKETAIFTILHAPGTSAEIISAIARHPRWKERNAVKLAVLRHRNTPRVWFNVLLPGLSAADIRQLISSRCLNPRQTKAAEDELARRHH